MNPLLKEIEDELKRTRLDKGRLYNLLTKIVENCSGGGAAPAAPAPVAPPTPAPVKKADPAPTPAPVKKVAPKKKAPTTA